MTAGAVLVRPATPDDLDAMSRVLVASITELCTADHHDNPETVARWTGNKTPAALAKVLADPAVAVYVAESDGALAAVGCIGIDGWIRLNYVAPAHRFRGISKALLAALEAALRARGIETARLESTTTAHRFYLAAGWIDGGPAAGGYAVDALPMWKRL